MVELDYDQVLEELNTEGIPEILDRYLETIAKNGDIIFPWSKVKPFLRRKLESVMDTFHKENPLTETQVRAPNCKPFDYQELKSEIMKSFDWFYAAPFTIQRLCELLVEPGKHYRRTDKLMRGIEKNVLVVSTVQPRPNKYSTAESVEKQASFKDIYPHFSTPPHNNNHSTSASSSSSLPGAIGAGGNLLNGSGIDPSNAQHSSSYDNSAPYLNSGHHSLANSFYDQVPPPPQLNNHHSHLMEMSDAHLQSHHSHANSHHSPHPHAHHPPTHPSSLAPLQQLDSFTNVFATTAGTSHHHITHLNSSYSLDASHLTNGSASVATSWSQEMKNSSPYDSLLHPPNSEILNDDNENIVVDDDEDEDEKDDDDRRAYESVGDEEKDSYFYATDSSNSNTSDSSSYNSDNSNDKDEANLQSQQQQQIEANSSSSESKSLVDENQSTPKKRPPTPPTLIKPSPSKTLTEAVNSELKSNVNSQYNNDNTEEVQVESLAKKLRVQEEKSIVESIEALNESQQNVDSQTLQKQQVQQISVADESLVASSTNKNDENDKINEISQSTSSQPSSSSSSSSPQSDESTPQSDESTPMEMNVEESHSQMVPEANVIENNSDHTKTNEIAMMQTYAHVDAECSSDSPDDQVMDEPMEQE